MLFSLVLLFELLEIIVLTMKKLFHFFSPYTSVFGSIVVYPRSRKDLSFLKNLSNLNYLFVSFFIRFSMISGQCPDPIETVACSFRGLCYIDSLFSVSIISYRR